MSSIYYLTYFELLIFLVAITSALSPFCSFLLCHSQFFSFLWFMLILRYIFCSSKNGSIFAMLNLMDYFFLFLKSFYGHDQLFCWCLWLYLESRYQKSWHENRWYHKKTIYSWFGKWYFFSLKFGLGSCFFIQVFQSHNDCQKWDYQVFSSCKFQIEVSKLA